MLRKGIKVVKDSENTFHVVYNGKEYHNLTFDDIARLKKFSKKQNGRFYVGYGPVALFAGESEDGIIRVIRFYMSKTETNHVMSTFIRFENKEGYGYLFDTEPIKEEDFDRTELFSEEDQIIKDKIELINQRNASHETSK